MKTRFFTLLLSLACLLTPSLAACGSGESAEKPDESKTSSVSTSRDDETGSESYGDETGSGEADSNEIGGGESSETPPEEAAFPLAGTWRAIQRDDSVYEDYFVIDDAGNMTQYSDEGDSMEYKLSASQDDMEWGEDIWLSYRNRNPMHFKPVGDTYAYVQTYHGYPSWYYYREEDFVDYDVVELTAENIADYVEDGCYFTASWDDDGALSSVQKYSGYSGAFRFKEGLGAPSFLLAELTYTQNRKTITIDPATGEVTVGDTLETGTDTFTVSAKFCAAGDYDSARSCYTIECEDNDGVTPILKETSFREVAGAETIVGKVYVPKGWNP